MYVCMYVSIYHFRLESIMHFFANVDTNSSLMQSAAEISSVLNTDIRIVDCWFHCCCLLHNILIYFVESIIEYSPYVAMGVVGLLCVITIIVIVIVRRYYIPISNSLKHKWGITKET